MKFRTCIVSAMVLAPSAVATPALAADYDPPIFVEEAPEYVPVEVGSGWYIRGDIAYTSERSYKDTATRLTPGLFNAALVTFEPALPVSVFSFSEKELPVSGSVGFGYHLNDNFRIEANLGLLYADKYSGSGAVGRTNGYLDPSAAFGCDGTYVRTTETATTTYDADGQQASSSTSLETDERNARESCGVAATLRNSAWNGTVNAYADLGTFAGFTPYVGVGGGLLYTRTKFNVSANCKGRQKVTVGPVTGDAGPGGTTTQITTDESFLCNDTASPSESQTYNVASYRKSDYDFLYTLNAGVAYQVSDNTKIDVGYQYVDAPDVRGFKYHQVKVGLRYDLW